jgi:hypothetical protein
MVKDRRLDMGGRIAKSFDPILEGLAKAAENAG